MMLDKEREYKIVLSHVQLSLKAFYEKYDWQIQLGVGNLGMG